MKVGSLQNMMLYDTKSPTPEVGMGATIVCWTDRMAATVTHVSASGKSAVIQVDTSKRADENGMSDSQQYNFTPNPNGELIPIRLHKDGRYHRTGGGVVTLGHRSTYHDYSF